MKCPFCLDVGIPKSKMVSLACGHNSCRPCMERSIYILVKGLSMVETARNPFVCPMTNCGFELRRPTIESLFANNATTKQRFEAWEKEQLQPRANMLTICPRKRCKVAGPMRYAYPGDPEKMKMVYCDGCGATYCEMCLHRYGTETGRGNHDNCRSYPVTKLCVAYRKRDANGATQYFDKFLPWLPSYAAARFGDADADVSFLRSWMTFSGAQECPSCRMVIERNGGCNHMICLQCGTDFCYECGGALFGDPDDGLQDRPCTCN